jgi:hypothetical protein
MLVGRQCVVEGGVSAEGSDGFCWKMVQQICGGVETRFNKYVVVWKLSTQYRGGMES